MKAVIWAFFCRHYAAVVSKLYSLSFKTLLLSMKSLCRVEEKGSLFLCSYKCGNTFLTKIEFTEISLILLS